MLKENTGKELSIDAQLDFLIKTDWLNYNVDTKLHKNIREKFKLHTSNQ